MDIDHELPEYSAPPQYHSSQHASSVLNEHTVSLETSLGSGKKWLQLVVASRAASPTALPAFYAGDVITGHADMDVAKSESIKAITVKVTAGTTSVGQEEQLFLNIEKVLWDPSVPLSDGTKISKFGKGHYSWPFEITLPSSVEVVDQKVKKELPLPASVTGRASPAYIDYKIILTVKRGALRVNQTLVTNFAYVPATHPDPPSPMIQKAYKENLPLVGPDGDPEGWHVLPPIQLKGTLFDSKSVDVSCTATLAKPLSYPRGAAFPLFITFTSDDPHALDLLSTPSSIRLLLIKSLATGSDATNEDVERPADGSNFFFETVARAVFWPPNSDSGGPGAMSSQGGTRSLWGEVDVKRAIPPSFFFPRFTIRYTLELQPFVAPGFVPTSPISGPLIKQRVTVTSLRTRGVNPRSHAPPEYVQEQAVDYNNSVGLLENGNQRFYHHSGAGAIA
ncbi:hypothetical protein BV22DRAFT_1005674 [Leucogyrophana mollusca]|uniref:Uncharacterized protein n=1 Tax=Leucogyrophana mollusca TaxID=85980 RepID=A0ACB8BQ66_9AGAM|nr:hypothetical protein BV22DRAFT_1005674 [Leucogyrophana mollusca]